MARATGYWASVALLFIFAHQVHAEGITAATSPTISAGSAADQCVTPPVKPPRPPKPVDCSACACKDASPCPVVIACPTNCPTAPAPCPSESSGADIEAFEKVATLALDASRERFEDLLNMIAAITAFIVAVGGIASYFGANSIRDRFAALTSRFDDLDATYKNKIDELDEKYKKKIDEIVAGLSTRSNELAHIITQMVIVEQLLLSNQNTLKIAEENHKKVTKDVKELDDQIGALTADKNADPSKLLELRDRRKDYEMTLYSLDLDMADHRKLVLADVDELKQLDEARRELLKEITKQKELRWTASIAAAEAVIHYNLGNYAYAFDEFSVAASHSDGDRLGPKVRRSSHLYNASCCRIRMSRHASESEKEEKAKWKAEAIDLLRRTLDLAPRYAIHASRDDDWKPYLDEEPVKTLVANAFGVLGLNRKA